MIVKLENYCEVHSHEIEMVPRINDIQYGSCY